MDDDLSFEASVWGDTEPINILPPPKPPVFATTTQASFDDTQFNDELDDFTTPPEHSSTIQDDDEFGDFGDFGEAGDSGGAGFGDTAFGSHTSYYREWQPLKLDPLPSREELEEQLSELLAPMWADDPGSSLTNEGIREMEGINQVLITHQRRYSRELYKKLMQPPPLTRPPNWIRSRIRRQHLITLGIPVNLDEVLPQASGKPLPPLHISSRPMSAPPVSRNIAHHGPSSSSASNSRVGTPQPTSSQFGPKPELDHEKIELLLALDTETLNLLPLSTLEQRLKDVRMQTEQASALLTHLLQTRESLQQDSEMYNRLIAELVGEAQRLKSGKARTATRKGSGMM
ncbi:hypothetical protein AMATHDRAFT_142743 [Amanita thiersii Skay4041]|uniref:Uncharacterized protein n=1 Tax=Amanita thiersii Skay4041 TaxID=703135 RepID=A0A2A9NUD0_9AGAR|nr:hypothetical protein AMATHDRAFT_142743 [Amanita thiersii Skay4041]